MEDLIFQTVISPQLYLMFSLKVWKENLKPSENIEMNSSGNSQVSVARITIPMVQEFQKVVFILGYLDFQIHISNI